MFAIAGGIILALVILANIEAVMRFMAGALVLVVGATMVGAIIYYMPTFMQFGLLYGLVIAFFGLLLCGFGKAVYCLCRFGYRTIVRLRVRFALRRVSPEQPL